MKSNVFIHAGFAALCFVALQSNARAEAPFDAIQVACSCPATFTLQDGQAAHSYRCFKRVAADIVPATCPSGTSPATSSYMFNGVRLPVSGAAIDKIISSAKQGADLCWNTSDKQALADAILNQTNNSPLFQNKVCPQGYNLQIKGKSAYASGGADVCANTNAKLDVAHFEYAKPICQ